MRKNLTTTATIILLSILFLSRAVAEPAGSAFIYQGRLVTSATPANGNFDLRFTLHDASTIGNQIGSAATASAIPVNNGLFTVTLDFGANAFDGNARWLEIAVRPAGTTGAFTVLSPRQPLLPTPYAQRATTASAYTGQVSDTQLSANIARLNSSPTFTGAVRASSFTGDGSGLTNLDSTKLTGPLALQTGLAMGAHTTEPAYVQTVAIAGNYAYVAAEFYSFQVYDISNPNRFVQLWSTNHMGLSDGRSVALWSHYACVADGGNGMRIYDIATPTAVVHLSTTNNGGYASSVAVAGSYAYLANGYDGLRTYYVGNPSNPTNCSRVNNVGHSSGVAVQNNYLFLANGTNGLRTFSLANPASPVFLASATECPYVVNVTAAGKYAYVAGDTNGLYVYDISNPASPILTCTITNPGVAQAVSVSGKFVALANSYDGVRIYDMSNPTAPILVSHAATGSSANGVLFSGTNVWLANDTDGLRCFSFGQNTLASIQTTPGSAVGIGGPPVDSMLDVEGDMHLNDHDLFLRAGNDRNHGLGWYGSEKLFSGMDPDGPVLYGYGGGMLGTTALGQRIALMWRANGTINLNPKDYFQGTLYVDGFLRGGLQFGSNRWSGIAAPRNTGCLDFYSDTTKKLRLTPGGCLTIDPDGYNSGTSSEYSLSFGDGKEGIFSKRTSGGNQFGLDFATRGIRRFAISSAGAVIVDPDDANDGSLTPGLIFGFGSGEGIASRRKTGSGLNGLEFYTGFKSRFFIDNGGNVGIGTLSPSSLLDIEGDARLNNHDLFLRDGTDTWHGLGFYGGSAKTFASQNINGPVLYGNSGGALGTIDAKGQKIALRWDNNSRVTAIGQLSCDDIIRLNDHEIKLRGGSDGNHALGWYGGTSPFAGQTSPDGPVLYGYTGGMLGSSANGSQWTLKWHHNGNVEVRGTLYDACDRSIKEDFAPVDCTQVLEKVSALPMQTWRYKSEEHGIQHLGPVAQDFHAAFGLGKDDKHIATVDADGVALAAIQGLNQKLETTLKQKDAEIQALKDTVAELKQIVSHLAAESAQKAY